MRSFLQARVLYKPFNPCKKITSKVLEKDIQQYYSELNIPVNSSQEVVRKAFLALAKKYHPDSGSPDADINKFCAIENAFRILSKHNSEHDKKEEKLVFDIKHTAPQHRQYLSFDGVGHGTPAQRMKQWTQRRAENAVQNVYEHRVSKSAASENNIITQENHSKKHDIKTKYGIDRIVEDLIQESISKGEFKNLTGSGKPLKDQNINPFVDFTTHKMNEVLINNGIQPEWIMMNKDIDKEVGLLKKGLGEARGVLGAHPFTKYEDELKWQEICKTFKIQSEVLNRKINTFNLIVPLMNKQKFHLDIEKMFDDALCNGECNVGVNKKRKTNGAIGKTDTDLMSVLIHAITDFLSDLIKGNNVGHNKKGSN